MGYYNHRTLGDFIHENFSLDIKPNKAEKMGALFALGIIFLILSCMVLFGPVIGYVIYFSICLAIGIFIIIMDNKK